MLVLKEAMIVPDPFVPQPVCVRSQRDSGLEAPLLDDVLLTPLSHLAVIIAFVFNHKSSKSAARGAEVSNTFFHIEQSGRLDERNVFRIYRLSLP